MSAFWSAFFHFLYRVLTWLGPLIRPWVARVGLGNVVELIVVGRRTGRRRAVLLGLLRVDGEWYLGHPSGPASWTRNLDATGHAALVLPRQAPIDVRPRLLAVGEERRRVIAATWRQHVFPGNVIYWLARGHIFAVGRYYRIEPLGSGPAAPAARPGVDPAAGEGEVASEKLVSRTPRSFGGAEPAARSREHLLQQNRRPEHPLIRDEKAQAAPVWTQVVREDLPQRSVALEEPRVCRQDRLR